MPFILAPSIFRQHHLPLSSAIVEPDPVPVEDVIEAAVAEDTSAPPPGTCECVFECPRDTCKKIDLSIIILCLVILY